MKLALVIFGSLLTVASVGSGGAKLAKVPDVMASMARVGVKHHQIPILAALEIAGGAGLLAGIWFPPLGILASFCLSFYFAGAVISHLRKHHAFAELAPALVILLIAITTHVLELKR